MKSLLFSLCIAGCIALPPTVIAEPDPGHDRGHRGERLKKELKLSDEQSIQVREIFKSSFGRCKDVDCIVRARAKITWRIRASNRQPRRGAGNEKMGKFAEANAHFFISPQRSMG